MLKKRKVTRCMECGGLVRLTRVHKVFLVSYNATGTVKEKQWVLCRSCFKDTGYYVKEPVYPRAQGTYRGE
jgi:5-methylcytosine-specific restriction endonuclease McrA